MHEVDIPDNWLVIRFALGKAFPEMDEAAFAEMQMACLCGILDVWILFERPSAEAPWAGRAIVCTVDVDDHISNRKNLLIYAVAAWEVLPEASWEVGFAYLRRYAKGMGQGSIISSTKNKRILRLLEKWGADTSYRYIELEV